MKITTWLVGLGFAAAILGLAGCGPAGSQRGAGVKSTAFHELSLEQALKKAEEDKKVVMIDFYADWCGPCHTLDQNTWTDSKVQRWLTDKTVAIKIDVDQHKDLASKYKAPPIPLLVFLKPDGTEIGRILGNLPPGQFLREAGALVDGIKVSSK